MELLGFGEGLTDFRKTRNDARRCIHKRNGAALPVSLAGLVRCCFELPQQELVISLMRFRMLVAQALDTADEAGPRAFFQAGRSWLGYRSIAMSLFLLTNRSYLAEFRSRQEPIESAARRDPLVTHRIEGQ